MPFHSGFTLDDIEKSRKKGETVFVFVAKCPKCPFEWGSTNQEQFFKNFFKEPFCPSCHKYLEISKKELTEEDGPPK